MSTLYEYLISKDAQIERLKKWAHETISFMIRTNSEIEFNYKTKASHEFLALTIFMETILPNKSYWIGIRMDLIKDSRAIVSLENSPPGRF